MHNLRRKRGEIYTEGGGKEGENMDEREAESLLVFCSTICSHFSNDVAPLQTLHSSKNYEMLLKGVHY